jgi:hypothetical protein
LHCRERPAEHKGEASNAKLPGKQAVLAGDIVVERDLGKFRTGLRAARVAR